MDRYARLTFICLCLVLVLAALGVKKPGLPMQIQGDEPTWVAMAQSLAEDGDLRFEPHDVERLFADFPFVGAPSLALRSADDWQTIEFDRPRLYPLLATPLVKLFGSNGLVGFNLLLLLATIAIAATHPRRNDEAADDTSLAWLFASAFFLLSLAWVYAFHPRPEILALAAVTVLLSGGLQAVDPETQPSNRRLTWAALSGLALLPLIELGPAWLWLALPVVALAIARRRWRVLAAWAAGAVVALLLGMLIALPTDGESWQRAEVVFENPLVWPLPLAETPNATMLWQEPSSGTRLVQFLVGKHGGLLPYFPLVLIALLLFALPGKRECTEGWWILLGLGLALWAIPPLSAAPFPEEVTGNPWLVPIYPAFFFLVRRLRPTAIVAAFALGTWTLGALLWTPFGSVTPSAASQAHVRGVPFTWLPTEAVLLPTLPDYLRHELPSGGIWARHDQVMEVGEDLWLLGGETVELWLESREEIPQAVFDLRNLADPQRLDLSFGSDRKQLEFADLPPQGETRRVEVELGPQPHRVQSDDGTIFLYRLELTSARGESPSWKAGGQRHFYAGAILTWLGTPEVLQRNLYAAEWLGCGAPQEVEAGETFLALSRLRNASEYAWPTKGAARVRLSYHWLSTDGEMVLRDGQRTELLGDLAPGEISTLWQNIEAPAEGGRYVLEFEPLYERVSWFAEREPSTTCRASVWVRSESRPSPADTGSPPASGLP